MAAVVLTPAGPAAFESSTSTIAATAVRASAAIATAERPLEARARVAANAGGIPRIIFAGTRGPAARTGRASFAREQKFGVSRNGGFNDPFARGGSNPFGFGVNLFDFEMFFGRLRFERVIFLFGFGVIEFAFVYFFL